jgi:hypothetical protein
MHYRVQHYKAAFAFQVATKPKPRTVGVISGNEHLMAKSAGKVILVI